jgi:hypothetical protein
MISALKGYGSGYKPVCIVASRPYKQLVTNILCIEFEVESTCSTLSPLVFSPRSKNPLKLKGRLIAPPENKLKR